MNHPNPSFGWCRLNLVFALILLPWAAAFADPPMDLPVPPGAVPVNPWVEQGPAGRAHVAPGRRGIVHMRDVAPAPPPGEEVRSHQQGDGPVGGKRSFEGIDLVSGEIFEPRRPMSELPPPDRPEVLDTAGPGLKAAGDAVASFEGVSRDQAGFIPPDTVLAVGPSHVLEAVNSGFTIYSKTGSVVQSFRLLNTLFAPALPTGWTASLVDPRVIYDTFHSKFVLLAISLDRNLQESYVFVAISVTSNPTGSWFFYRYRANEGALNDQWLDFPALGADLWGLYFTGNYHTWANAFRQSSIWVVGPDVFNGGSGAGWRYLDLRWPTGSVARDIQVAHPHSQSFSETFFVNTRNNGDNDILLWELTGDRATSPNLVRTSIGMRSYDPIDPNNQNTVDQPGTATGINGNDARVTNAVYSQRRVYATLPSAPTNNSAGWVTVRLNVDTTSKEWDTLLWGGDGYFYFFPALTVSGGTSTCARIGVMGSWTHAQTQFASGLFKIYQSCNSTSGPLISFISGSDSYVALDNGGRNRWGDYSGAAFDWQNGYLWGAVEYAGPSVAGNGRWRTRIVARKFDPDLKADFTFFCNGLTCFFFDSSVEGRYPITSYSWTFGDGSSSSAENPTHTYNFAGTYTVTLRVTDSSGAMSSFPQSVTADNGCPGCPECIVCPE